MQLLTLVGIKMCRCFHILNGPLSCRSLNSLPGRTCSSSAIQSMCNKLPKKRMRRWAILPWLRSAGFIISTVPFRGLNRFRAEGFSCHLYTSPEVARRQVWWMNFAGIIPQHALGSRVAFVGFLRFRRIQFPNHLLSQPGCGKVTRL